MPHSLNDGVPVLPIPQSTDKNTIRIEGVKPTLYPYRNAEGEILFYIGVVYQDDKPKIIRPICWVKLSSEQEGWGFKNPFDDNRPLLNLPNILKGSEKIVIVGEGEKTAAALTKLFPDYVATTSCGGAKAAHKTGWSILKDRDVILSLDLDEPGELYGCEVYKLCQQAGARSIKMLPTSIFGKYTIMDGQLMEQVRELPKGYDLADALEEGWTDVARFK